MLGCAELAELYVGDEGPRRNAARAAELAVMACDGGNGHGCATLAKLCTDRLIYPEAARREDCSAAGVAELRKAAVTRLLGDCAGWNAHDCATLATIYHPGDPETARRFAAGACQGGDPEGCQMLARLDDDGGAPQTIAAAR
jgi:TPR repeat protein